MRIPLLRNVILCFFFFYPPATSRWTQRKKRQSRPGWPYRTSWALPITTASLVWAIDLMLPHSTNLPWPRGNLVSPNGEYIHQPQNFISTLILILPDQEGQFIVEVVISDNCLAAVLSQHVFHLLNATTTWHWELHVIKLALEEWWHWLEGPKQPFLVLINHKNIEYPCTPKRLNSH